MLGIWKFTPELWPSRYWWHYCSRHQDASLACYNGEYIYPCCDIDFHCLYNSLALSNTLAEYIGTIRLGIVDTSGNYSCYASRVEVYHSGEWGTVCDDSRNISDANVTRRQVWFGHALGANCCSAFGEGSGSILLGQSLPLQTVDI